METFKPYLRLYFGSTRMIHIIILALLPVIILANTMINNTGLLIHPDGIPAEFGIRMAQSAYLTSAIVVFMIFAAITGSMMFNAYSSKESRLAALVLPASTKAKFWSYFVVHVVAFFAVFLVSLFIVDWLRVALLTVFGAGAFAETLPVGDLLALNMFGDVSLRDSATIAICAYGSAMLLQSFFALGSIVWKSKAFIKTIATLAALGTVCVILVCISVGVFLPEYVEPRFSWMEGNQPPTWLPWILAAFFLFFTVFNYVVAYMRLKETELQNRW